MAMTAAEKQTVARFVREDVRQLARKTLRLLIELEDAQSRYVAEIKPILDAQTGSDSVDEMRGSDGVAARSVTDAKAVLVVLAATLNATNDAQVETLRRWLVGRLEVS